MKNLFKNEETSYPEVITKIHEEFRSAGDKLYEDALAIINSTKILNEDKVVRLKKLGFVASKEVIEAEHIIQNREINEMTVKRISYYREQYPLQKFITETQVKEICEKYNLVYGPISQYTGFVPENKLKQMEAFCLRTKDARYVVRSTWDRKPIEISYEERELYYNVSEPNTEFIIAAPRKDFKISSHQAIKESRIVNKPIPDPVVLAPVNGGYLIVAAWGAEASDPIVVNDITN